MEFLRQNAIFIGLAIGSGFGLLWPMLNRGASGVANVSPTEAVMLMSRGKPLILDVRDAAEFAAGHIQGAKHIPVAELASRMKEIAKFKDKPVLVHCQKACAPSLHARFCAAKSLSKFIICKVVWIAGLKPKCQW